MPDRLSGCRAALAVLALTLVGLLAPAAASAGTYRVWSCTTPSGALTSAEGWAANGWGATGASQYVSQECATGGGIVAGMTTAGAAGNSYQQWTWTAPAGTSLVNARFRYAVALAQRDSKNSGPGWWVFRDVPAYDGDHVLDTCYPFQGCSSRDTESTYSWTGTAKAIGTMTGCAGEAAVSCNDGDSARSRIDRALFTLQDDLTPVVSGTSGSVLDARTLTGRETLVWSGTDQGGGLWQSEVRIGDVVVVPRTTVDVNGGRCGLVWGGEFPSPVPCKLSASQTLAVDTAKVPNGTHVLTATVWDAAGNAATVASRRVTIDNPVAAPPPRTLDQLKVDNGTGGSPSTGTLVPSRKRKKTTVGYAKKVVVKGKLVDAAGAPLVGAQVDVLQTMTGGGRGKIGEVITSAKGEYSYAAPMRSNRLIELAYSRERGADLYQSTQALAVSVRAGVTIKLKRSRIRRGGKLTMTGRVRAEGFPSTGVLLTIRVRERRGWSTVGTARTDGTGRFRWTFRPRASYGSFPLQARVEKDDRLPALPGTSRSVRVRIG